MNKIEKLAHDLRVKEAQLTLNHRLLAFRDNDGWKNVVESLEKTREACARRMTRPRKDGPLSEYDQGLCHGYIGTIDIVLGRNDLTPDEVAAVKTEVDALRLQLKHAQDVVPADVFGADPDLKNILNQLSEELKKS